ncbi:alkane hydroxylase MAH1-like [Carica papaya]|uniref:alkane hydroxylase MAH1-like n=1 Tax=Carica papaya TaxID=3649 RepID=UPI000B8CCDD5|nr:alkane hydroxylase MAH1-like [Carica papaya]
MAMIGLIEILLAVACFLILGFFLKENNGMPRNFPVLGTLPDIIINLPRLQDWATEFLDKSGCTFLLKGPWFANMDLLVTVDPANIHYIMSSNFSNFPKGSEFKKIFDVLGDGIFNADNELWKNQRKTAQSFMSHRGFYKFLVKTSRDKVENGLIPVLEHVAEHGLMVDLQDLFQRFTFDSTCKLVTGYDPGCLSLDFPEIEFAKALDDAEEVIFYRHIKPQILWKLQKLLGIGEEKKMIKAYQTFDRVISSYLSLKKEELSQNPESEAMDLLTCYMRLEDNQIKNDDKLLRDTFLSLLLAGRDTTSSALSWFFWLISQNPKVEAKIREELNSNIKPSTQTSYLVFHINEVDKLVYLHSALCESLRLYPPVPFQHKEPLKPDVLPSGHYVDPKMKILFSLYAMGRMRSIWGEDCYEYKPERWISEQGRIKHEPSYKFLAFNAGPRTCLGKEVAFTQLKLVAAAIIYNYKLQVVEGQCIEPGISILLHMKNGLKVKVSRRYGDDHKS